MSRNNTPVVAFGALMVLPPASTKIRRAPELWVTVVTPPRSRSTEILKGLLPAPPATKLPPPEPTVTTPVPVKVELIVFNPV